MPAVSLLHMEATLRLMASVAILSTLPVVLTTRIKLRKTTLLGPWGWGVVALTAWTVTWLLTEGLRLIPEGVGDQLWLASAALLATPFIAMLGARRPGSRVWSVFIVAPLAVVLDLPAATAWNRDLHPAPLHLEVPMLAGYGLVLFMGAGNYLGTRFLVPAVLAAVAGLAIPTSMSSLHGVPDATLARAGGTLLLAMAVWIAALIVRKVPSGPTGFERLWSDFRNLFGVVWARRILDRVNEAALRENWPVRLHLQGFLPVDSTASQPLTPDQSQQVEQTLRWLLRRFVDREWIDERLEQSV
jgi:hypothetical protein